VYDEYLKEMEVDITNDILGLKLASVQKDIEAFEANFKTILYGEPLDLKKKPKSHV
jgi:hypothetical protein